MIAEQKLSQHHETHWMCKVPTFPPMYKPKSFKNYSGGDWTGDYLGKL
jgi:hypothetical protein